MQKAEWRSRDVWTLVAHGSAAAVSVNGMHMSATKSEGYDGVGFSCVAAEDGATLSLEGCDLTCEGGAAVARSSFTGPLRSRCLSEEHRAICRPPDDSTKLRALQSHFLADFDFCKLPLVPLSLLRCSDRARAQRVTPS